MLARFSRPVDFSRPTGPSSFLTARQPAIASRHSSRMRMPPGICAGVDLFVYRAALVFVCSLRQPDGHGKCSESVK